MESSDSVDRPKKRKLRDSAYYSNSSTTVNETQLKSLDEKDKKKFQRTLLYLAELSDRFQSRKSRCYTMKDKVDDFSIQVFELSIKLALLLKEIEENQINNDKHVNDGLADILHPLVGITHSLQSMYKDIDTLYEEVLEMIRNSKKEHDKAKKTKQEEHKFKDNGVTKSKPEPLESESSESNSLDSLNLTQIKCIRSSLPVFNSSIDSSVSEFKKKVEFFSAEILEIAKHGLSIVKKWLSTAIHDLEKLESNVQIRIEDIFSHLE